MERAPGGGGGTPPGQPARTPAFLWFSIVNSMIALMALARYQGRRDA
ncbi:MAG TPA: hypothetical protein VF215_16290 [Thermoanaerobaculia bacterium]